MFEDIFKKTAYVVISFIIITIILNVLAVLGIAGAQAILKKADDRRKGIVDAKT